jgi:hypothetical protein
MLKWHNGKKYEGFFKAGKQHGDGEMTNEEGLKVKGKWVNGKKV